MLDINSVEDDKHILAVQRRQGVRIPADQARAVRADADGNDWLPTAEVIIRTRTPMATEALAKNTRSNVFGGNADGRRAADHRRLQAAKSLSVTRRCNSPQPNSPAISPKACPIYVVWR